MSRTRPHESYHHQMPALTTPPEAAQLNLPKWLKPASYSDEIDNQKAKILYILQLVVLGCSLSIVVILILNQHYTSAAMTLIVALVAFVSIWVSSRHHLQLAGMLLSSSLFGLIIWFTLTEPQGLHDVAILGLPIITIILSLTSRRTLFVVSVGLMTVSIGVIAALEALGRTASVYNRYFPDNIILDGSTLIVVTIAVAIGVRTIVEDMFTNLANAQQSHIQLQKMVAELERRNREVSLLNEVGERLQTCHTDEDAYKTLAHYLPRFFPNEVGILYVLSSASKRLEQVAQWGNHKLNQACDACSMETCPAVQYNRVYVPNAPYESEICLQAENSVDPLVPYLCMPLIAYGETLGLLHIRSAVGTPQPSPATAQLVIAVTEQMALALANLRLRESLRQQSIRDPLTNLFNRRFMEESLARELANAERHQQPLAVVVCDLDHFKRFNDTFGHAAGDMVLRTLAKLLREKVRDGDIVCRYGGEEFVLILPGATLEQAYRRMELLREEIAALTVVYSDAVLGPITISVGVASFPGHGRTAEEVLKAADDAAYRAKDQGRNRVILAIA